MEFLSKRQDLRNDTIASDWRMVLTETEIRKCVTKCANRINREFAGKDIILTCILKGAAYFFVDLSRELTIPHSTYFIEASSYLNSQTQSEEVKILSQIVPSKFKDRHVILVDELFDSGQTLTKICEAVHQAAEVPMNMITTCTLFKKIRPDVKTNPDIFGIAVPNVWYVGYGLDHNQEKRGWTYLFACPKCHGIEKGPDDEIFNSKEKYDEMRRLLMNQIEN